MISGCAKKQGCTFSDANNYDASAEEDDGSCIFNGKAVFWKDETDGLGAILVVMEDGTSGNITLDYTSTPDCDASGCFTFTAAPGTYDYVATEPSIGMTWNNTITITSKGCTTRKLTY